MSFFRVFLDACSRLISFANVKILELFWIFVRIPWFSGPNVRSSQIQNMRNPVSLEEIEALRGPDGGKNEPWENERCGTVVWRS